MAIDLRSICPLLQVFDMPTSIRFYRDLLGFEVVRTAPPGDDCDWALLELKLGGNLMLNTAYERDAHGDTALFFRCPEVDAAYAHLRERGLRVAVPVVAHYGMKQLYVTDPDGYSLCFQWPA